jgi:hypothetical protein
MARSGLPFWCGFREPSAGRDEYSENSADSADSEPDTDTVRIVVNLNMEYLDLRVIYYMVGEYEDGEPTYKYTDNAEYEFWCNDNITMDNIIPQQLLPLKEKLSTDLIDYFATATAEQFEDCTLSCTITVPGNEEMTKTFDDETLQDEDDYNEQKRIFITHVSDWEGRRPRQRYENTVQAILDAMQSIVAKSWDLVYRMGEE